MNPNNECKCHCHLETHNKLPEGVRCKCIQNCVHCHPERFPTPNPTEEIEVRSAFDIDLTPVEEWAEKNDYKTTDPAYPSTQVFHNPYLLCLRCGKQIAECECKLLENLPQAI